MTFDCISEENMRLPPCTDALLTLLPPIETPLDVSHGEQLYKLHDLIDTVQTEPFKEKYHGGISSSVSHVM